MGGLKCRIHPQKTEPKPYGRPGAVTVPLAARTLVNSPAAASAARCGVASPAAALAAMSAPSCARLPPTGASLPPRVQRARRGSAFRAERRRRAAAPAPAAAAMATLKRQLPRTITTKSTYPPAE